GAGALPQEQDATGSPPAGPEGEALRGFHIRGWCFSSGVWVTGHAGDVGPQAALEGAASRPRPRAVRVERRQE
ncbi:unnamed protein product, partial [Ectocarpus fasciculatus]